MRTPQLASLVGAMFVASIALLTLLALVGEASAKGDEQIWMVTTSEDPGPDECAAVCSLRAAIAAANESGGPDLIHFDIRGSTTISPQKPLPGLRDDAIEIDGRTQRGWVSGRPPVIYLDGRRAGANAAGIIVTAADAGIRGLGIGGFARYGIGVLGAGALRAVVEANWIGTSADGRSAAPNRLSGVAVLGGAADAQIGGACEGCGNRIAGNSSPGRTGHGVVIGGGGTTGALVVGNVIGLDRDDAALPNDDGVLVVDAAQAEVRGNVICASRVAGVEVRDTGLPSSIDGNWIGVTRSGVGVGNDVGIFLGPGAARVRVGAQERNVVAGNRVGIAVEQGAREVQVRNNWVGLVPTTGRLEDALGVPNREKGISVIAGAAEVRLVANQVLAGERGIVVAGAGTTHISMQRNVLASQGAGLVGIEVRDAHFVTVGGEFGLGNSIAGVQIGIVLVDVEEAVVANNSIGRDFARVGFSAALETRVGIELGAGVRAATVERNNLGGIDGAAIAVTGRNARDNRFTRNVFGTNAGLDIDLGSDGPTPNDEGDRDSGPHGLLNTPVIESYHVEREASGRLRSVIRGRGLPGATVEVYSADPEQQTFWARGGVGADGRFKAVAVVVPVGDVRAINVANVGGTSEFSAPFPTPARQYVAEGQQWLAIQGDEQPVADAFEQLETSLEVVWHWDPVARTWLYWSPRAPMALATLRTVQGGDVVLVRFGPNPPRNWFSATSLDGAGAAIPLVRGQNLVSWTGGWESARAALARLEAAQPGLVGRVWQWDTSDPGALRWRLIWPLERAEWDPGLWAAPVLTLTATRDGVWDQGE